MTIEKIEDFLEINRKLEVKLDGDEGRYYKSFVLGVDGKHFLINPPYRGKHDLHLHQGDRLEVVLLSKREKYLFSAEVIDRVMNPLKGYILKGFGEAKRIQLRAFVRIQVAIDTEWAILPEGLTDRRSWEELEFKQAVMVDLSGGGAGLVLDELLPEGKRILLRFPLEGRDKSRVFTLVSEVRRANSLDDRKKYAAGVSFLGISEKERDQIIEYVFYRQRKMYFLDGE